MNKRLLLITPFFHPNVGGVETRLNDLVKTLGKFGHSVDVLTYQPLTSGKKGKSHESRPGVSIWRMPWPSGDLFHKLLKWPFLEVLYITPGLMLLSVIFMAIRGRHIDAIHTPGLNSAIIGRCLKALFGMRWVVSTHTIYGFRPAGLFSAVSRWILKEADYIVALSEPSREELIAIGLPHRMVSTEYTWVDQERFAPMDKKKCRESLNLSQDAFICLFVGRLLPEKGAVVITETAARLTQMQFIIAGLGPQGELITAAAKSLPNIRFAGHVDQERLPFFYNAADIFILPSQYREGLGRVVLESLSCGIPVLMSDRAAIADLIAEAAFIVSPDAAKLAVALSEMASHPEVLEEKKKRARPLAERLFGEGNIHGLFRAYGWER